MSEAIDPSRPLGEEFRRIAENLIGAAIASLSGPDADPASGPHEARRCIKDLRALLRLVRSADETYFHRENRRYRDIAQSLAGVRGAAALVETVDRLVADFPDEIEAGGGLSSIRARLVEERDRAVGAQGSFPAIAEESIGRFPAAREALAGLSLPILTRRAADVLGAGMERTAGKAEKMRRRAGKSGDPADFHELRKAVKHHWAHLRLLADAWPKHGKRRLKAMKRLGNRLGELHDIAVLRERIQSNWRESAPAAEIALLHLLMDAKEKALERKALKSAERRFRGKRERLARRLKRCYLRKARKGKPPEGATLWRPSGGIG